MLKFGKIGAAIFLSLLLSLTLLASGAFAQSETNSTAKTTNHVATTASAPQGVNSNLQVIETQQVVPQQANYRCWWRRVWRYGRWTWIRVCSGWGHGGWGHGGWWHRSGWGHGGWWHGGWHRSGWGHGSRWGHSGRWH